MKKQFIAPPPKSREPTADENAILRMACAQIGDTLRNIQDELPEIALRMEQVSLRRHGSMPTGAAWSEDSDVPGDRRAPRPRPYREADEISCHYVEEMSLVLTDVVRRWGEAVAAVMISFELRTYQSGAQAPHFAEMVAEHAQDPWYPFPAGDQQSWMAPSWGVSAFTQAVWLLCRSYAPYPVEAPPQTIEQAEEWLVWLSEVKPREAELPVDTVPAAYLAVAYAMLMSPQPQNPEDNPKHPDYVPGVMGLLSLAHDFALMGQRPIGLRQQLTGRDLASAEVCGIRELDRAVQLCWNAWSQIAYARLGRIVDVPYEGFVEYDQRYDELGRPIVGADTAAMVQRMEHQIERQQRPGRRSGRDFITTPEQAGRGYDDKLSQEARDLSRDARADFKLWEREEAPEDPGFRFSAEEEVDPSEASLGTSWRAREHGASKGESGARSRSQEGRVSKVEREIAKAFPTLSKPAAPPGGKRHHFKPTKE